MVLSAAENSRSAALKSPACRNVQPRDAFSAAGLLATGAVTTFDAHALVQTSATNSNFRITKILLLHMTKTTEKAAWHIRYDRHLFVARLMEHDAGMAVDAGDALAIGGAVRIERQRDPADVERQAGCNGLDQLVNSLAF